MSTSHQCWHHIKQCQQGIACTYSRTIKHVNTIHIKQCQHQIKQCQHQQGIYCLHLWLKHQTMPTSTRYLLPALMAETSNNVNINKVFTACTFSWNIRQCQHQQGIYCLHFQLKHQTMSTSTTYLLPALVAETSNSASISKVLPALAFLGLKHVNINWANVNINKVSSDCLLFFPFHHRTIFFVFVFRWGVGLNHGNGQIARGQGLTVPHPSVPVCGTGFAHACMCVCKVCMCASMSVWIGVCVCVCKHYYVCVCACVHACFVTCSSLQHTDLVSELGNDQVSLVCASLQTLQHRRWCHPFSFT